MVSGAGRRHRDEVWVIREQVFEEYSVPGSWAYLTSRSAARPVSIPATS